LICSATSASEHRLVVGEQHAVTIENQSARRRNQLHLDAVLIGTRPIFS
jgi:hypothetical protein